MMGTWFQARAERRAAEAYCRMARAAAHNQIEATARAEVSRHYMFAIDPPPIEKRGGKWFAIMETGASVPKVEKRQ